MRSVINDADEAWISAIVDQQFDYASRILAAGLVPIIEPNLDAARVSFPPGAITPGPWPLAETQVRKGRWIHDD